MSRANHRKKAMARPNQTPQFDWQRDNVAMQERLDGKSVDLMVKVTEQEYRA